MAPLLEISGLSTEIRLQSATVHALDQVSLQVQAGECLGIVGESGSGKTMTALSVMRLLPPGGRITGGTVALAGREISALDESAMRQVRGNEIGMVFQDPAASLDPTMTIGAQIAETVRVHRGADGRAARARAAEVLGLVGMPRPAERAGSYPHQLSGGMRQRVMIAMALACEPRLLIADEPTSALDVTIAKQILDLLDDLRRRLDMAVILVTHDLGIIAGRADRAAVMYAGRVMETASTARLFAGPRHPYTEALLRALPQNAARGPRRLETIPGSPPDLISPLAGCRFASRCRYVQDACLEAEPPLAGDRPDHAWRCYFPLAVRDGGAPLAVRDVPLAARDAPLAVPDGGAPLAVRDGGAPLAVRDGGAPLAVRDASARVASPAAQNAGAEDAAAEAAPGTDDGVLLRVTGLVKNFPVTRGAVLQRTAGEVSAVAGVTFSLRQGQTFGLVGESGCGKTTIGRLIVGLDQATSGSIVLDGVDLTRLTSRERRRRSHEIQLMFQDSYAAMDPRMRAGAILREPLAIQRAGSRQQQHQAVAAMLEEVGLPRAAAGRYPHEFSGGQRQRLGLARALILRPRLVVADEPVSALDVSVQAQILNLMLDLQRDLGLSYLFISHDLSVVRYMSDTIGVMYLGNLVETGPADDVYRGPVHPYTRGLIDTVPVAGLAAERRAEARGVAGELPSAISPPSGCRFRTRCPRAQDLCAQAEPPLRPFSAAGHLAACHFPLREPEGS